MSLFPSVQYYFTAYWKSLEVIFKTLNTVKILCTVKFVIERLRPYNKCMTLKLIYILLIYYCLYNFAQHIHEEPSHKYWMLKHYCERKPNSIIFEWNQTTFHSMNSSPIVIKILSWNLDMHFSFGDYLSSNIFQSTCCFMMSSSWSEEHCNNDDNCTVNIITKTVRQHT